MMKTYQNYCIMWTLILLSNMTPVFPVVRAAEDPAAIPAEPLHTALPDSVNAELQRVLNETVFAGVDFRQAHFLDVVDYIAHETHRILGKNAPQIYSAVQDRDIVGSHPSRRVTLKMKNASLQDVLVALTTQLQIRFQVLHGMVMIYDKKAAAQDPATVGAQPASSSLSDSSNAELHRILETTVLKEVGFRGAHLLDVVEYIVRETNKILGDDAPDVFCAVQSQEIIGTLPSRRVTLTMINASLEQVLIALTTQLHIRFQVEDGMVVIYDTKAAEVISGFRTNMQQQTDAETKTAAAVIRIRIPCKAEDVVEVLTYAHNEENRWTLQTQVVYRDQAVRGSKDGYKYAEWRIPAGELAEQETCEFTIRRLPDAVRTH